MIKAPPGASVRRTCGARRVNVASSQQVRERLKTMPNGQRVYTEFLDIGTVRQYLQHGADGAGIVSDGTRLSESHSGTYEPYRTELIVRIVRSEGCRKTWAGFLSHVNAKICKSDSDETFRVYRIRNVDAILTWDKSLPVIVERRIPAAGTGTDQHQKDNKPSYRVNCDGKPSRTERSDGRRNVNELDRISAYPDIEPKRARMGMRGCPEGMHAPQREEDGKEV